MRTFALLIGTFLILAGVAFAAEPEAAMDYSGFSKMDIIPTPENPQEWDAFRKALSAWRTEERKKINYQDKLYQDVNFQWASSAFNCYFLMMCDEAFYDPQTNQYTLDKFLVGANRDFGRVDSVVLWQAYPLIGLDDRNQFDYYRDMPGGLEGIKKISDFFHSKDIKVFICYNPWDTGTRRENVSDIDGLVNIVKAIDADGIFLDTLKNAGTEFREKLDGVKPGIVLEGELALPVTSIADHHLSWAQSFVESQAPGILRNKWFEPRHIQHGIWRWNTNHIRELHTAWMNGSGVMIWENIFGQWKGWSNRDKSLLKAISPIQKRYSELFTKGEWIPMADPNPVKNIYANLWMNGGTRLWTLVNRSAETVSGELLHIELKTDENYYDLIRGIEIKPQKGVIDGVIGARGVGCFLAVDKRLVDKDFAAFLKTQSEIYKNAVDDPSIIRRTAQLKPVAKTNKYNTIPQRMVVIPAVKKIMKVDFKAREPGYYASFDESYLTFDESFVARSFPKLHHIKTIEKEIDIPRFAMDETPVTNKQFETFLKETGYKPAVSVNFLKHWVNGKIPDGKDNHPVVYVDLNDARAYARWAGKRLPTEEEWQWAAQGDSYNKYPWGNEMKEGCCNPGNGGGTTPVDSYPKGKSPWGCYDMCGNVWELTESEYDDGRNRFCILKGGSFYKAKGSEWYFDGGALPVNFAAKQLLMYPGLDRCATIGFRCAVDLHPENGLR
ncbi:MAG: formylglycine-generating enzyme family protein [Planctomycetaceae bacterium]|jgi:formylglycine-generating enzyme required for sulfatase activity|nr:formylglycine-generating enzyme family protein [Planctomycetaceae bacterium]